MLESGETDYGAAIQTVSDKDYFYLDLPKSQLVTVEFTTGGYPRDCRLFFEVARAGEHAGRAAIGTRNTTTMAASSSRGP